MGEGNGGAFDDGCEFDDGGAFDGVVAAAVSSRLNDWGDSLKGRRTTILSGVRASLDAGVGGASVAAVTGVDDDMGAGLN